VVRGKKRVIESVSECDCVHTSGLSVAMNAKSTCPPSSAGVVRYLELCVEGPHEVAEVVILMRLE
jgi:hypothetical protein